LEVGGLDAEVVDEYRPPLVAGVRLEQDVLDVEQRVEDAAGEARTSSMTGSCKVSLAPGRRAPAGSEIVPRTVAICICARAAPGVAKKTAARYRARERMRMWPTLTVTAVGE
jgi:hypothetical protein